MRQHLPTEADIDAWPAHPNARRRVLVSHCLLGAQGIDGSSCASSISGSSVFFSEQGLRKRLDVSLDLVADATYLLDRLPGGIGKVPVELALPWIDRAGVSTAHRDNHVGTLCHVVKDSLGRSPEISPSPRRSMKAAAICGRPALCVQRKRTAGLLTSTEPSDLFDRVAMAWQTFCAAPPRPK